MTPYFFFPNSVEADDAALPVSGEAVVAAFGHVRKFTWPRFQLAGTDVSIIRLNAVGRALRAALRTK